MSLEAATLPLELQQFEQMLQQQIDAGDIDVPMLPEVANRALLLAQNPDSDASEMAKLIQSDQSLAGHVMRIANSVAYTPMSNLVSLQQAIARLGMRVISEIALTAAIGAKLFHTPGYEPYVASVWRHALATSLWSKEIARHCRSNVEVAFLAGLLHSIGRPAILQVILDLAKQQQIELTPDLVHQLEQNYCQQITEQVVFKWKMPQLVIDAIRWNSEDDDTTITAKVAAVVSTSAAFSVYMLGSDKIDKASLYTLPELTILNVYQDEVESLLNKVDEIKQGLEGLSS
ncbi:MAG: HDOD domain-containing protein [Gammaproteobacteria bacterium]|nr:HDOD domain-containing protein [Gammaproteobacteria bacterium]